MGKLFSNIISRLNKFFFLYSDEYWWAVFIDCQCIYLFISDLFACHGSGLRIYLFPPQFIFGFSTQSQRRALQVCSVFSCVKCMHRIDAQYILQWILQCSAMQRPGACCGGAPERMHRDKVVALSRVGRTILHHTRPLVNQLHPPHRHCRIFFWGGRGVTSCVDRVICGMSCCMFKTCSELRWQKVCLRGCSGWAGEELGAWRLLLIGN